MMQYVFWILTAYLTNPVAAFSKVVFRKRHALDFNLVFVDGERLFGDGKTVEGCLLAISVSSLIVFTVSTFFGSCFNPLPVALGSVFGDVLGSFIKRRVRLARGEEAPLLDQLDFLLVSYIFFPIPSRLFYILIIVTPFVHRFFNIVGYRLGIKGEPW